MKNRYKHHTIALLFFCILLAILQLNGCTDETPNDIKTIEGNTPIGPYLQNLSSNSVSVLWTSLDEAEGRVIIQDTEGNTITEVRDRGIFHSVQITGLKSGTQYTYQVKERKHLIGQKGRFRTPPLREASKHKYSFAVLGDSGTGSKAQYEVAHQMRLYDPAFVLHTGDIVYPTGAESQYYDKFFRPYQDLLVTKVFWAVLGNHDYQSSNGKPFEKFFETPANNQDSSERFYSFEYGNALFVALDSEKLSGNQSQQKFLKTALAASQHTWRFVFFHEPLYSSGSKHGSNLRLREQISPILEFHDVDIVFTGHDHHYERTKSRKDYMQDGHGTIYIVSGGGGVELREVGYSYFTEYSASVNHFIGIQIDNNQLHLEAIDRNGNVFDVLHLEKSSVRSTAN